MPPKRKSTDGGDGGKGVTSTKKARSVNKNKDTGVDSARNDGNSNTLGKSKGKGKKAEGTSDEGSGSGPATPTISSSASAAASSVTGAIPKKNKRGQLVFPDHPKFRPNLTPKEILQMGSFGGTYFRPIKSSVTGKTYRDAWKEFPADWFEGLKIQKQVANPNYLTSVNTHGVNCGGDLHMWESSGWMRECDPYGWFQWYCRFYLGRRCDDDDRQISRGLKVFGPTGRWRTQLCNRILVKNTGVNNFTVSPKIRQLMQHWGYKLTEADLQAHAAKSKKS